MSSTNKTTNYNLSQFVGTDIPSILNDYNGDMQKIDTAVHNVSVAGGDNASAIASLQGTVSGHTNQITQLDSNVTALNGRMLSAEGNITETSNKVNNLKLDYSSPQVFYGSNYNTMSAMLAAITAYINEHSLDTNNIILEAYNKTLFLDFEVGTTDLHFSSLPSVVNDEVVSYYFRLGDNEVVQSLGYKITNGTSSIITTVPTTIVLRNKIVK